MPLTYSHSHGFAFYKNDKQPTKKTIAKRKRLARAARLDDGTYAAMIAGEIALTKNGDRIFLEPYFAGVSEPVLLEQDAVPYPQPHITAAACAAWRADIAALEKTLKNIPADIREDTLALADFNYSIAVERQNDNNFSPANDEIGEMCEQLDAGERRKTMVDLLNTLNIACGDDGLNELRERNARVKAFYATFGELDQESAGMILRGIDARQRLICTVRLRRASPARKERAIEHVKNK